MPAGNSGSSVPDRWAFIWPEFQFRLMADDTVSVQHGAANAGPLLRRALTVLENDELAWSADPTLIREIVEAIGEPPRHPPLDLEQDLAMVLNRYDQDSRSDTPDYVLARYLIACLAAWHEGIKLRNQHAPGDTR